MPDVSTDQLPHIVHMTSVHDPRDPRIFLKECRSLARAGFRVTLIAPANEDKEIDGVHIRAVTPGRARFSRFLKTTREVYRTALSLDADIYHFHDPELLPIGSRLAGLGKPVVYDIHEDYFTAIRQKPYLPAVLRDVVAHLFRLYESRAVRHMSCVIAESYYAERFPGATEVLNYPIVDDALIAAPGCDPASRRLLYTGGITEDRGALAHAGLLTYHPDLEVSMMGRCAPDLAERLRETAKDAVSRLHIEGEGGYVAPSRIRDAYLTGGWLAGLALFPDTAHYRRKILTKFFEYMLAGLPVICSNFRSWKLFVEELQCGFAVDPEDPAQAVAAINYLQNNPDEAREMGLRGRKAVLEQYRWDNEADKLVDLYKRLYNSV